MKKIEYQTPEIKVMELQLTSALLTMSNGDNGGADKPSDW